MPARLGGNFFLEQLDGVTRIAALEVRASVVVNGSGATLQNGQGALLITNEGIAGVIEGDLATKVSGVSAGAALVLPVQ